MSISIRELSSTMVGILEADDGLNAFRAGYRGEDTYGVTEHCPMVPETDKVGAYAIPGYQTPYLCVTNVEFELVSWDGESAFSDLLLLRRVLGVLNTERPTVESDEQLKAFMQATFAALKSDAMFSALRDLGVKRVKFVQGAADGLGPIPQGAFAWDIELTVAGAGVMRG